MTPLVRSTLHACVEQHIRTRISYAGALLSGWELLEVAEYLIQKFDELPDSKFEGVVFHGHDMWQVMDRHLSVEAKATSPVQEHEAFVIFDEARCRYAFVHLGPMVSLSRSVQSNNLAWHMHAASHASQPLSACGAFNVGMMRSSECRILLGSLKLVGGHNQSQYTLHVHIA
jgi:hypothetical protein